PWLGAPAALLSFPTRRSSDLVLARLAGRIERLPPELHGPVGVRERAGLLGERRGRQHDVGEVAGLREEDVLHDQHLELRERLSRDRKSTRLNSSHVKISYAVF